MKLIKFIAISFFCIASSLLSMDAPKDYNLALLKASQNGIIEDVIAAISMGADVNTQDTENHSTPLQWAADKGHTEVAKILLAFNADKDAQNQEHYTALHYAAQAGDHEIVKLLLDTGADKDAKTDEQNTALHLAANKGHTNIVQLLLYSRADKDAKNARQQTALNCSAANEINRNIKKRIDIINRLYLLGAPGNYNEDHLQTQLDPRYSAIIKLLLQKGADVNHKDIDGNTALMSACENIDYRSVKILLKAFDVNVNLINRSDDTAFTLADRKPKIRKLLELRAKAEESKLGLFEAIKQKNIEKVREYLKTITFYVYDVSGDNPLHLAIQANDPKIIRLILYFVPDLLYMPNKAGKTPVDLAVTKSDLMRFLIGLEPLAQDKTEGKSNTQIKRRLG